MRVPGPWRASDRRTFAWTTALGVAALVVGYWGASGTVAQSTQLRWTALAVAGLGAVGLGNAVWLAAAVRDVRARREQLLSAIAGVSVEARGADAIGRGVAVVTTKGTTHFHRPHCLMVVGKTVSEGTGNKDPCPICRPG